MLFELRIRFTGDEGDEMTVMDLSGAIQELIDEFTNVDLRSIELHGYGPACHEEGRKHAARN